MLGGSSVCNHQNRVGTNPRLPTPNPFTQVSKMGMIPGLRGSNLGRKVQLHPKPNPGWARPGSTKTKHGHPTLEGSNRAIEPGLVGPTWACRSPSGASHVRKFVVEFILGNDDYLSRTAHVINMTRVIWIWNAYFG